MLGMSWVAKWPEVFQERLNSKELDTNDCQAFYLTKLINLYDETASIYKAAATQKDNMHFQENMRQ
jgi:hypothetical protein